METSNLARRFKHIILFLLLSFSPSIFGEVYQDRAVLKVEDKVFFVSDLNKLTSYFSKLHCLKGKSYLLEAVKMDQKSLKTIPKFSLDLKQLAQSQGLLEKYVVLIKLQLFANRQKEDFTANEKEYLKKEASNCFNGPFEKWANEQKSLMMTEFYLRQRFAQSTSTSTSGQRSFRDSVQPLISTIDKKLSHEFFF